MLAKVSFGIDVEDAAGSLAEGRRIPFDYLIVATGAQHAYFGHDEWAAYGPGLKTSTMPPMSGAASCSPSRRQRPSRSRPKRRRLLNFVVVGGGPTGVEMAGAIAELAKRALAGDFRSIDPREARIILVEAAPRLLAPFDAKLSEAASARSNGSASRCGSARP